MPRPLVLNVHHSENLQKSGSKQDCNNREKSSFSENGHSQNDFYYDENVTSIRSRSREMRPLQDHEPEKRENVKTARRSKSLNERRANEANKEEKHELRRRSSTTDIMFNFKETLDKFRNLNRNKRDNDEHQGENTKTEIKNLAKENYYFFELNQIKAQAKELVLDAEKYHVGKNNNLYNWRNDVIKFLKKIEEIGSKDKGKLQHQNSNKTHSFTIKNLPNPTQHVIESVSYEPLNEAPQHLNEKVEENHLQKVEDLKKIFENNKLSNKSTYNDNFSERQPPLQVHEKKYVAVGYEVVEATKTDDLEEDTSNSKKVKEIAKSFDTKVVINNGNKNEDVAENVQTKQRDNGDNDEEEKAKIEPVNNKSHDILAVVENGHENSDEIMNENDAKNDFQEEIMISFNVLNEIRGEIEGYKEEILKVNDDDEEKSNFLQEMLLRNVIRLENLETFQNEKLIEESRNVLFIVRECIQKLEEKYQKEDDALINKS